MKQLRAYIQQFVHLSEASRKELEQSVRPFKFQKGDLILEQGMVCRHIYFVEAGILRVYQLDENGKEITSRFTFAGQMIASYYSMISGRAGRDHIQALSDGSAYTILYDDILKLFDQHHDMEKLGRLILEDYFLKRESRIIGLQSLSAMERYQKLIEDYPGILNQVPLGHIASYLGITQETLSRVRNKFR